MSVALACTFRPINDWDRFVRLRPGLEKAYTDIVLVVPPVKEAERAANLSTSSKLRVVDSPDRALVRFLALKNALETEATHFLCADLDRLMRWVETAPVEWHSVNQSVQHADRYLGQAANLDLQRREAEKRDQDPKQWEMRVRLARDIVEAGLEAWHKPLAEE